MNTTKTQLDLGCGTAKRPGFIGLDLFEMPGVDHVLDLTSERFPFDDDSVDTVFSAHFLEHIDEPNHVFQEIGRVCRDGARIEIWTPYAWTNEAFLYGHLHCISEEMWIHLGVSHRDAYVPMLNGRWLLRRFVFVIDQPTIDDLARHAVDLDFAVKYLKGVVREFGVEIEYRDDLAVPPLAPERVYATERFGPRTPFAVPVPGVKHELKSLASSTTSQLRSMSRRARHSLVRRLPGNPGT